MPALPDARSDEAISAVCANLMNKFAITLTGSKRIPQRRIMGIGHISMMIEQSNRSDRKRIREANSSGSLQAQGIPRGMSSHW